MSEQPLGREEVARIAIALKGLDEYRETPLNDLIKRAIRFLRDCEEALEPENLSSKVPLKWFSQKEAAKFVTGNPRAQRALTQFNRYLEFVGEGGYLRLWVDEAMWLAVMYSLKGVKKDLDRVDEGFCLTLKEKFSEWREIDKSERQRRKAKNSRKKSLLGGLVKKSEPGATKTQPRAAKP
jgi:hypothetical protein